MEVQSKGGSSPRPPAQPWCANKPQPVPSWFHAVRRSAYVHERLHNLSGPQKLPDELYDGAEKFRIDFERAQLSGNYASLDLFSSRSGKVTMSDSLSTAKMRLAKAFKELGNGACPY